MSDDMKRVQKNTWLAGANSAWLESMYEDYLENPESIAPEWRAQFSALEENTSHLKQSVFQKLFQFDFRDKKCIFLDIKTGDTPDSPYRPKVKREFYRLHFGFGMPSELIQRTRFLSAQYRY